ncbi:MAG: erythromycin biosynthesis sensory transduction protein eryC1 [Chloroflexi bacterium RBG_16_54_18]|nr:MAG: erythromycin biosynthesis sensory transduction protein eryC1 [Chloroflexi bacterium RBG_16_54_18]
MSVPIPMVDLRAQYEPLEAEIQSAWRDSLASMRLFLGPNVQAFEQEFAAYCGVEQAIGVGDGTSALHLALRACGVGPGDEVITVSHTFIATVEAIIQTGAVPVFVDIDENSYTMDVSQIEAKITRRTKAILPVHLYGQCADMDPILQIARDHQLYVIEDACQAHGAEYKGRKAGSMGDLAGFSFYYSKNLGAYGEAGMVTTRNEGFAHQIRKMRDHGSEKRYLHDIPGWNCRLDELQAAVLRVKLPHLDQWNNLRRERATIYRQKLSGLEIMTPAECSNREHIYHLYVIRVKQRDELKNWLSERNIGTGIHYPIPCHLQEACSEFGYTKGSLPVTEQVVQEILSLPMYPELRQDQIERVIQEAGSFFTA